MQKLLAILLSTLMLCTTIPFATVFAAEKLWRVGEYSASFAARVIDIPEATWDVVVIARPYCECKIVSGATEIHFGEAQFSPYN